MNPRTIICDVTACVLAAACGTTDLTGLAPPCPDRDSDGHGDVACGGDDCDDGDPLVHPGASEACLDGLDQDCDGFDLGPLLLEPETVLYREPWDMFRGDTDAVGLTWTGSEYAVAWQTGRPPECTISVEDCTYRTFLARVGPDGVEIGEEIATEYLLPGSWEDAMSSHVTWTGSELFASWVMAGICALDCWETQMRFARTTLAGYVVDSGLIPFSEIVTPYFNDSQVAWNGSVLGIVYSKQANPRSEPSVMKTVYPDASPTGDEASLGMGHASLAWTGSEFGVALVEESYESHSTELHFIRLGPEADVRSDTTLRTFDSHLDPVPVAWTGSGFGLLRDEYDGEGSSSIYFTELDPGGDPESGGDHLVMEFPSLTWLYSTNLVWTEGRFAFLLQASAGAGVEPDRRLLLVSFDEEGATSAVAAVPVGTASSSDLVWTGGEIGLARVEIGPEDAELRIVLSRFRYCE